MAPVRVTSSEFADGRRNEVASPDSEQIELAGAVPHPHRRNSVSVEQIQDRWRRTALLNNKSFVMKCVLSFLVQIRNLGIGL